MFCARDRFHLVYSTKLGLRLGYVRSWSGSSLRSGPSFVLALTFVLRSGSNLCSSD